MRGYDGIDVLAAGICFAYTFDSADCARVAHATPSSLACYAPRSARLRRAFGGHSGQARILRLDSEAPQDVREFVDW